MLADHHILHEGLSDRAGMGDILSPLEHSSFVEFVHLFRPEEGRMGITVTFVAILELVREGLIDIVQAEPFAPLHVRAAGSNRTLRIVADNELPGVPGEQVPADERALLDEAALAEPAEDISMAGDTPSEDETSLVGDTPLAGEESIVGEASLTGGQLVVEVIEFDDLPALDAEAGQGEQPTAGERTEVKELPHALEMDRVAVGSVDDSANEDFADTDKPPSPGEDTDE